MPEEQDFGFQRRLPSVYRSISEIRPEDIRVCIIARIIDMQDNTVVLDDGTGKITAVFNEDSNLTKEIGALVRVFGRVINMERGFELQGEIMQDVKDLDVELYKKIETVWNGGF